MNYLFLGDCLNILRENISDNSVDLVYIDPPFNSKRDYNIFFDSNEIQTQRVAFEDTWTLKNIQDSLAELHTLQTDNLYFLLITYQKVAPHAFPYLVMMALRIVEIHRVLKDTGSFYLHCDPTMSHYLKTVCDIIFSAKGFINEIIWKRSYGHGDSRRSLGRSHDAILFYTKSEKFILNRFFHEHEEKYINSFFKHKDERGTYKLENLTSPNPRPNLIYEYKGYPSPEKGWRVKLERMKELDEQGRLYFPKKKDGRIMKKVYLDELEGQPMTDLWTDIKLLSANDIERLGYPTQKPKALLERIIKASSNEGDVVLDAFGGCGTTVDAAESLRRNWIVIDISPIAISLIKRRLKDTYGTSLSRFEVRGIPTDEQSAIKLWNENPFAFQDWWLTELEVFSTTIGKKGADKGIDGIGQYLIDNEGNTIRAAFQVKGGDKVKSADIDALLGILEKHKCELGVFLSRSEPTRNMLETVSGAGFIEFNGVKYPRLQVLTLKEYFSGKKLKLPQTNITFKPAQFKGKKLLQTTLDF